MAVHARAFPRPGSTPAQRTVWWNEKDQFSISLKDYNWNGKHNKSRTLNNKMEVKQRMERERNEEKKENKTLFNGSKSHIINSFNE